MKESWTGEAIISHLTLNCDLGPSQTVLVQCNEHYGNVHAYQVSSHSASVKMAKLCPGQTHRPPWVIT